MTVWRRSIRSNPQAGIRVHDVLASALTSELLSPSPELWLVSPWISDIVVINNRDDHLVGLVDESLTRDLFLSDVLGLLSAAGCLIHAAVRPDPHNDFFLARLERSVVGAFQVHTGTDLHEKTLCGRDWLLSGSMNFTYRGIDTNDEAVTYVVDAAAAAQARLDLEHRWLA